MAVKVIRDSDPEDYKPKFNIYKSLLLPMNYFPRGKVRAPKSVRPQDQFSEQQLRDKIAGVKLFFSDYEQLYANAHFKHPIFGHINKKKAIRFMEVHSEHHLKIIRDILSVRDK